jgi:hypothetical protein
LLGAKLGTLLTADENKIVVDDVSQGFAKTFGI